MHSDHSAENAARQETAESEAGLTDLLTTCASVTPNTDNYNASSAALKTTPTHTTKKPDNPLEAAMFLQMFPETPKPIIKKSLAEIAAESSPKKTGSSDGTKTEGL